MRAVEVAVAVDHLGLNPYTETDAERLYTADKRGQTVLEAVGICVPVAQTCAVADTCAEPAVIHYDGIHAAILCAARKVGHQILVDIEEESFP